MGTSTSDGNHLIGPLVESTISANEAEPAAKTSAAPPAEDGSKRKGRAKPAPGRRRSTPKTPPKKSSGQAGKKKSPKRPAPARKAATGPVKRRKARRGRPRAR